MTQVFLAVLLVSFVFDKCAMFGDAILCVILKALCRDVSREREALERFVSIEEATAEPNLGDLISGPSSLESFRDVMLSSCS